MLEKILAKGLLKYIALSFSVLWLAYFMFQNEIPTDVGDGIMHFFYSQASLHHPELFLHHWGKPFFILISSPFSQFGFNGIVIFNILVYTATVLIGFRILQKFKVSVWLQLLFPLLLLIPHDVTDTIFGGLTEPLFNLAAIASLWMLIEKKYIWFAVIISLMPFMRSEGQLPLVLGFIILMCRKEYKIIPFLFLGFILYAIAGVFVYADFWWYFTKSPYTMDNDIYGAGTWSHYLLSYKNYLGNPSLYIIILGMPSMLILAIKKRWIDLQIEWAFYAFGIFIGVIFLHSYFLATGQNGSMGLTRIATQGMPIFVLINIYYISRFRIFNHLIAKILFGLFSIILIITLVKTKIYPTKANPMEKSVIAAATYLKSLDLKDEHVFFHFPLLSFSYGENPFRNDGRLVFYTINNLSENLKNEIKPGDYIVRDSHFGPAEANMQLEEFARFPELIRVKEFISSKQLEDRYNETEGIIIFRYVPLEMSDK